MAETIGVKMERPEWVNEERLPSAGEKLLRKSKEAPFVPLGMPD